ncbi:MAG: PLD nuclease N-terminal domain-containing protein [Acidobacteriia bacterium]|nr:PLD nuclease N-terminal domain-containing protein [Terriglobia bacterium]
MLIGLVVLAGVAVMLVFWLWMLIDCLTKEPDAGNTKVIWVLVIVFTHIIGAALYFFIRRPQRWAEAGK